MKKILVVVHIYYVDQLDLIIQSLKNIPIEYDLYVTIGTDDKQMVKKTLVAFKPDCHFISVDNVGYDVWPFIKVINQIDLSKYSYVIKLHTKRNLPGTMGACVYRAGMIIDDPFTSRRHISKILKLRRTAKRQKRLINLIVCPIFVAKYRRQLRQKLWNNYLNKFISFENDAGQGGQL